MKLLSIAEAADILRCSTKQVRRLIDSGRLRFVRLGKTGRSDRIHPDDLHTFINQNRQTKQHPSIKARQFPGFANPDAEKRLDARLGIKETNNDGNSTRKSRKSARNRK